jgi:hypothetical protein
MDNGTSEYVFVTTFFAPEPSPASADTPQVVSSHLFSPTSLSATLPGDDAVSNPATDVVVETALPKQRADSVFSNESQRPSPQLSKEDQTTLNAIWKQIMDPALNHTTVWFLLSCTNMHVDKCRHSRKLHWNLCHLWSPSS